MTPHPRLLQILLALELSLLAPQLGAAGAPAAEENGDGWRTSTWTAASIPGRLYSKSIPSQPTGMSGTTRVYRVVEGVGPDRLIGTYEWYSPRVLLYEELDGTVVRLGHWTPGKEASDSDLGIAFYRDGQLLQWHSALKVAGRPGNVQHGTIGRTAGYELFSAPIGVRKAAADKFIFEIEVFNGRVATFDLRTGEFLPPLDYIHADERAFNALRREVESRGGSVAQSIEAYDLLERTSGESQRVMAERRLSAERKIEELRKIGARAHERLLTILGPEVGPAYIEGPAQVWLPRLEAGEGLVVNLTTGGGAIVDPKTGERLRELTLWQVQPSAPFLGANNALGGPRDYTYVSAAFGSYARSSPGSGGRGRETRVYHVLEDGTDAPTAAFNWYSPNLLHWDLRRLIRDEGPHPGNAAVADDIALAFYRDGWLQHAYSTLDLAGSPTNVRVVDGKFTVIKRLVRIRSVGSNDRLLEIETVDGRLLQFLADSGELVPRVDHPRSDEQEFWQLRIVARIAGLPESRAIQVYDYFCKDLTAEVDRLLKTRFTDPAPTRAAFQELGGTVRGKIIEILGPDAGAEYIARAKWWLSAFDRGEGVQFPPEGIRFHRL